MAFNLVLYICIFYDTVFIRLNNLLEAVFYIADSGAEPVKDWLKSLSKEERKIIGSDIDLVQQGWPIGKPLVDGLGNGL